MPLVSTVRLSVTRPLAPVGVSTNMVLNSPIPEPGENPTVVSNQFDIWDAFLNQIFYFSYNHGQK